MNALKKNILLIAYVLLVLTYLTVRVLDYNTYALIIQPLMVLTLGGYYLISTQKRSNLFLLALVSIMIGSLFFIYDYSTENFIIALIFIFIANMLFLLMIVHRMGIIKIKDILVRATPIYILLLIAVCSFFSVLLGIKVLIYMYCVSLALLLSFAFLYRKTSLKKGTLLMLISVVFMIVRDFFTGLSKLLEIENQYYLALNIVCHGLAMYLVCKSLLLGETDEFLQKKS